MYWQNTQYLCTPALGLAAAAQHKDIFEVRGVWRYDKAEWNLLVFPHMTLCARVWRCVCPAGPYTCPALLQECHVSAMRQCSTNELWWERLGSAVGTLLPSLLSVPGNRSASGRGRPAARSILLSSVNAKQNLSPPGELHESMLGFLWAILHPPHLHSPRGFIHGRHTAVSEGLKKEERTHTETKQSKCGNFLPVHFFSLPKLLSALPLLTQVFVHLWPRISVFDFNITGLDTPNPPFNCY